MPSVAVDPSREYVVVLRPGDASDGAVTRADAGFNIWQAALRTRENPGIEAQVQNLLRTFCDRSEPDAQDFDVVMANTAVCLAIAGYKNDDGRKDPGFELATENWAGAQDVCDSALCQRFHANHEEEGRGYLDREAIDQSAPDLIEH